MGRKRVSLDGWASMFALLGVFGIDGWMVRYTPKKRAWGWCFRGFKH